MTRSGAEFHCLYPVFLEPVGETLRYAHSSPFYFTQRGALPVRTAEQIYRKRASLDPGSKAQ